MVKIEDFSFGRIRLQGQDVRQDLKIVGDTVVSDWWRIHGHRVAPEDVLDVLEAKPDVLVVGSGLSGQMLVTQELQQQLDELGVALVVQTTEEAVKTYNSLLGQGRRVAGAFHLTC